MNQLILSSSTESKYILTGAVNLLLSNRRARTLLKVKLDITEETDRILINSDEPIERVAHLLGLAAKYINAEIIYDNEIASDIQDFHIKELEFQVFGEKARSIKNNNCVIQDFDAFAKSLESNMANRRLYPLQLLSAYHMAFSQNACNFSVPGAGKTSIVYGAYTYLKNLPESSNKKVDKIMIIGPLSAFGPWESEYEECFGFPATCKRINGALSSESKKQYFYGETAEVILISYASVVGIKESLKYFLKNNRVMVVLDEAHKIKNTNGGITATSIMELASFCSARVILTGTPAPNGYEDLYNLFHFIWPNVDVPKYTTGQLRDMTRNANDSRVPNLIKNIDPILVREQGAKIIADEISGRESVVVPDPTLLHDKDFWLRYAERPVNFNGEDYILVYSLNHDLSIYKEAIRLGKKTGKKVVGIKRHFCPPYYREIEWLYTLGPQHFIWLINHAAMVITNSFHAEVFSLILNTSCYPFLDKAEEVNERLISLLNIVGHSHVVTYMGEGHIETEVKKYDFEVINERLKEYREKTYRELLIPILSTSK